MTTEQLRQNAAAMIAFADGKPIEWANIRRGDWTLDPSPDWDLIRFEYRPKPEPKTCLWSQPEDVPGLVCWVREQGRELQMMITSIHPGGIAMNDSGGRVDKSWKELGYLEYSTDRINWKPCEVTE